jgi:PAS domain S-box-containing protein
MKTPTSSWSSRSSWVRALLLATAAIGINIALGYLVRHVLQWPLWLDSIGTILVGALLGPLAGAATGVATNLLVGVVTDNHAALPFAITAAFIGWAAGYAAQLGAFDRLWRVALAGLLVGFGAALISAPIAAYVFGGLTDMGAAYLHALLEATGATIFQLTTLQGLISDPLDKVISFVAAWLLWRPLRAWFPPLPRTGTQPLGALKGYTLAVVASLLALLIFIIFLPATGPSIFSIFYLAVLLSAWRGGLGPALLAISVGAVAIFLLLIAPAAGVRDIVADWFRLVDFVVVASVIAFIAIQLEQSRQRLAQALHAERTGQAQLRAIADGVTEALALIAPDRRVLAVNRRFGEMFGVPAERVVGQRLEDVRTLYDQVFEDAAALYAASVAASADAEHAFTRLIVQQWPQRRELLHYSTPVHSADGFLGRLYVFRDVTHEREVDRMKTEFVSLVSHELRTPLTSIKGFTELVLDGDAGEINEEVAEYLGIVYNNAERLVALVNDLLDLSRIESGRIQLKSEPVDLADVVKTVVVTMQQKLQEKGQSLTVTVDPAANRVTGDSDKLVQVLTNYVSNAYKYTPEGGALAVDVSAQDNFARVAVTDNGHGIAPEDQTRLFTRFYRVDNSMTREVGGTGLGLSIVKQLIELMGGEVGVQSAPAAGSTFYFTVPLAAPAEPAPAEATHAPAAAAATQAPATVLVVEDDPDVAQLVAHHLQKAGYVVRTVHTAEGALAALADDLPDLITLDIDLPDMQGDDLARHLHADPLTSDIPVLVLSVFGGEDSPQFGAYALPKPIDQEELVATVDRMLQKSQQGPVLVVDDDADVRALLENVLRKQGYDVETAADGERGLALAVARHPGLILLDMRLPGMDGFAVLQALKREEATARIPVIAMTASPELKTSARARVLTLGAADFIGKPFDAGLLVKEVKVFLGAP